MGLAKIVCGFLLATGEAGSWSHWLAVTDLADAQTAGAAYIDALAADTLWKGLYPSAVNFTQGTAYLVDQATGVTISEGACGSAYAGSGVSAALPPQCAVAVTLRTALSGASYRGRYYLPAPEVTGLTTVGRLSNTAKNQILVSLTNAHGAEIATGPTVTIYSRVHHSIEQVTQISVGDVVDTQRRRRDKLVESRSGNAI